MFTLTIPTAQAKPGDLVTHIDGHELRRQYTVIKALAPVDDSGMAPEGVQLLSTTSVEHFLYPDTAREITVVRVVKTGQRGYTSREAALRAATKAAGWKGHGGHYYRPAADQGPTSRAWYRETFRNGRQPGPDSWVYTGLQGVVGGRSAASFFEPRGYVRKLDGRWYVTLPLRIAAYSY